MEIISKKRNLIKLFCPKCKYVKWIKEKNLDRKEYTCACDKKDLPPEPHRSGKSDSLVPLEFIEVTDMVKEVKKNKNKR